MSGRNYIIAKPRAAVRGFPYHDRTVAELIRARQWPEAWPNVPSQHAKPGRVDRECGEGQSLHMGEGQ
jgi:hypothetical protein